MNVKLLIVDDKKETLVTLKRHLSLREVDTIAAETSANALKIIENDKINIVLLDINMPGMTGTELLRRIKKIDFSIQVIMMTEYSRFANLSQFLEMGAVDYILKPFDNLDEVFDWINESTRRLMRWRKILMESVKLQREKRIST